MRLQGSYQSKRFLGRNGGCDEKDNSILFEFIVNGWLV